MLNAGIMTSDEFDEIIGEKDVCVIDFSASWCGPCRMMAPILEDISDKYKGKYYFYQIDVDSAEELAQKFEISAVPTILVFLKLLFTFHSSLFLSKVYYTILFQYFQ